MFTVSVFSGMLAGEALDQYFDISRNIVDWSFRCVYISGSLIILGGKMKQMKLENAAKRCAELGNITRLSIFRLLVRAGENGLSVGDIQRNLEIPGSTLSHHIQRLVQVGLVNQRRDSRTLYCEPQFDAVRELADYLVSECCSLQTQVENELNDKKSATPA